MFHTVDPKKFLKNVDNLDPDSRDIFAILSFRLEKDCRLIDCFLNDNV